MSPITSVLSTLPSFRLLRAIIWRANSSSQNPAPAPRAPPPSLSRRRRHTYSCRPTWPASATHAEYVTVSLIGLSSGHASTSSRNSRGSVSLAAFTLADASDDFAIFAPSGSSMLYLSGGVRLFQWALWNG